MVLDELIKCIRYDDPIRLRKMSNTNEELEKIDRLRIESYALAILKINRLIYDSKCYIDVKPCELQKYSSMIKVVEEIDME